MNNNLHRNICTSVTANQSWIVAPEKIKPKSCKITCKIKEIILTKITKCITTVHCKDDKAVKFSNISISNLNLKAYVNF